MPTQVSHTSLSYHPRQALSNILGGLRSEADGGGGLPVLVLVTVTEHLTRTVTCSGTETMPSTGTGITVGSGMSTAPITETSSGANTVTIFSSAVQGTGGDNTPSSTLDQGQQTHPSHTSPSLQPTEPTSSGSSEPLGFSSSTPLSQTYLTEPNIHITSQGITLSTAITTSFSRPVPSESSGSAQKRKIGLIIGLGTSSAILVMLLLLGLWWRRKKYSAHQSQKYTKSVRQSELELRESAAQIDELTPVIQSTHGFTANNVENVQSMDSSGILNHASSVCNSHQLSGPQADEEQIEHSLDLDPSLPFDTIFHIQDIHILQTQLNAAMRRLAVLEMEDGPPPDYVSSASQ
ncbi:hypothetical protein PM082_009603 [Marasmius tenuissimus]|nr:hypothetical protein PM082_009603 [Marasmius tenuissimus]